MNGQEVRAVFEAVLPEDVIHAFAQELGVVQRERKLEIFSLVRAMVISSGTPGGAHQADVLRAYLESEVPPVSRSAFYRWFDEPFERLMERLKERALLFARRQEVDLPGPLSGVKDWLIVDSETVTLRAALQEEYPGAGPYAALKVHKHLSVGCGAPVYYHLSPAREHDSPHLTIDESWRGYGLLMDLAYAKLERLADCETHGVLFVIRLKENWKPKVLSVTRGEVSKLFLPGADFDALLDDESLVLSGKALDAKVSVGSGPRRLLLRLVGVPTPKGYCFFLTNVPSRLGPLQVGALYRVRWEIELSMKLDKSVNRLDELDAEQPSALRALLHASLLASLLSALLAHQHNRKTAPKTAKETRKEAPLHTRRLALQLAVSCESIARAMELTGKEADAAWERAAVKLVHSGKDPNWRRSPSALDQLRGWKPQPVRRHKLLKSKASQP